jgi:hypothetical protein
VPDPLAGKISAPPIPNCPATDDAGINVTGNNTVTISAGTHVYHGQGISLTGNSTLNIASGNHTFWFCDGADFRMTGNQNITKGANTTVKMYFIGGGGLSLTGNSGWALPSGQYVFVNADLVYTGNATLSGTDVFFYFSGNAAMRATGNGSFAFSAPTTQIYAGYVPGVLVYANANNTRTFRWVGNSGVSSNGAIYLPSATLEMTGNSGQVIVGQLIADRFDFVGNAQIGVRYYQYVDFSNPKIYLVE